MAIGSKKEACLHLAVLVVALTSCLARRPDVRTVVGGGYSGWLNLMPGSDAVTYRVIMPDRQACPTPSLFTTAFDWKVQFTVHGPKPDAKICVDFGRLKLTGNSTKFTVHSGRKWSDYMLTSIKYPLIRKRLSTVKCYNTEHELTLMFHSDCDGNLKDYFSSWIYVYYQTSSHPVYHLDGNCRHKYRMVSYAEQVTVRSYIWNDVSNETLPQDCTLELSESYTSYVLSHSDAKLCTKWTFQQTACQLSVDQVISVYSDMSDLKGATIADCQTGFNAAKLATCYSILYDLIIGARRGKEWKILQTGEKADGALFFEMEVTLEVEEKKQESTSSSTHLQRDYSSPNVFHETESETYNFNDSLFFAPVALLIGVCSCLCCLYCRQAKHQQAQFPGAPYSTSVLPIPEHMRSAAPAPQNIAMQRLMGPGNNPQSHTSYLTNIWVDDWDVTEAGRLEFDRMAEAAPPLSYTDETSGVPGAPARLSIAMQPLMGPGNNAQSHTSYPIWVPNGDATEAGRLELDGIAAAAPPPSYTDVTSGGSQPNASPRPPYAASTELPPPPFFTSPSALPAAPPAYKDLFPSNI